MPTQRETRTPAQWYCRLAGLALLFAGVFGWIASAAFDSGSDVQGDLFLGFEVNGWHNLVHLLSGVVLLAAAGRRTSAKTIAILFGVVYGAVAIWGLVDGDSVLGLLPVNVADNILHIALAALGILAGLASQTGEALRTSTSAASGYGRTGRRIESDPIIRDTVAARGTTDTLDPATGREPAGH
jgi:hypothetical protein